MGSEEISFCAEDVLTIKTAKSSTALGPDGLATARHETSGKNVQSLYEHIGNTNWENHSCFKSGKPLNDGSSYRLITLLYPVVKVLEALVMSSLKHSLSLADY